MIRIVGCDGVSKRRLTELLANTPGNLTVAWGIVLPGALNGQGPISGIAQLKQFENAGVLTVEWTQNLRVAEAWVRAGVLVFGREACHTQGRDIVGPTHPSWPYKAFWSKVVTNVAQEWRVHAFLGRRIGQGLKFQDPEHPGAPLPQWSGLPIRNRKSGWRMKHEVAPPPAVTDAAIRATVAVGYDFGAVDVLWTTDGRAYVLEVNTAPRMDDWTAQRYADAIAAEARRRQS